MAMQPLQALIRRLRHTAGPPGQGTLTDAELVQRWTNARDEAAFELLLRRHGPLVLAACRRLVGDPHAAEDCFQATWLLFLRKVGSIRRGEALPAWLHRVACRVALRARATLTRRRSQEETNVETLEAAPTDTTALRELHAVLDEEINRLPDHYRRAFVLCVLQDRTYAEAARELGRPQGTVAAWAARARERLRTRLRRRGLLAGEAGVALWAEGDATSAGLPCALAASTLQAAARSATGGALPAGVLSPRAVRLAGEVGKLMALARGRPLAVLLSLFMVGTGIAWVALRPASPSPRPPALEPKIVALAPLPEPDETVPAATLARILKLGSPVKAIAVAADGKTLASGGLDGAVILFDLHDGSEKKKIQLGEVKGLAFSLDGKSLASAQDDRTVLLLDSTTLERQRTLAGHGSFVTSVAFTPDSRTLASGSARVEGDKLVGEVRLWDVATGALQRTLSWEGVQVWCVAFTPDGNTVVAGGGGGGERDEVLRMWDRRTGTETKTLKRGAGDWIDALPGDDRLTSGGTSRGLAEVLCLAFAPDGRSLAVGGNVGALLRLEVPSLRVTRAFMGPRSGHGGTVRSVAFGPDGRLLVSCGSDKTVKLWDAVSGRLWQDLKGHEGAVNAVALSADGTTLATAGEEGTVRLWKVEMRGR